ncbi:hypothetical protein B9W62_22265 [Streptomyces sp. CS113]|uniref:hypothetical protein n=1 Tax=Streptomyces sp. CS113 TaxID=1982761 RepID=UPI000B415C7A|nr:hypothetical protein [Streptomyces sp. CS113]OWA05378.1 hypothetical protein B9W62_22265 [Streptomyces sp. CS113]
MNSTAGVLSLFILVVLASGLMAALVAVLAGLLAWLDGVSLPEALRRAGTAFAATLTVLAALAALAAGMRH